MYMIAEVSQYVAVASFAEAWIEISSFVTSGTRFGSPPSRRRGLKSEVSSAVSEASSSRLLRGGVD